MILINIFMRFNPLLNQLFTTALINTLSYYTNLQVTPVLNQLFSSYLRFRTYSGVFLWKNEIISLPCVKFLFLKPFKSFTINTLFPSTRSASESKFYRPAFNTLNTLQKVTRFKKLTNPLKRFSRTRVNHNFFLHLHVFKYFSRFYSTKLDLFVPFVRVEDFYFTQFKLPNTKFDENQTLVFNKHIPFKRVTSLRRNYFLNLLGNLSKQVRIRKSTTTSLNMLPDNLSTLLGVKRLESTIKRHPIFSKQLSFLNNQDLNETPFSPSESIKSQFLIEFYDTFTFNYGDSQSIEYNILGNASYWDYRLTLLTTHFNSSLLLTSQFRQYILSLNYKHNLDYARVIRRMVVVSSSRSLNTGGLRPMAKLNELPLYDSLLWRRYGSKSTHIIAKLNPNLLYSSLSLLSKVRRDQRRWKIRKNNYFSSRLFDRVYVFLKDTSLTKTQSSWIRLMHRRKKVTFDNIIQKGKFYRFFLKFRRLLLRRKRLVGGFISPDMKSQTLQSSTRVQKIESLKLKELYEASFGTKKISLNFKFRSTTFHRFVTLRLVANRVKKYLYRNHLNTLARQQSAVVDWIGVTKLQFIIWLLMCTAKLFKESGRSGWGVQINPSFGDLLVSTQLKVRQILNEMLQVYRLTFVNNSLPKHFRGGIHNFVFRMVKATTIQINSSRLIRIEQLFLRDYEKRLLILAYFNSPRYLELSSNPLFNLELSDFSRNESGFFLKSQNNNHLLTHSWSRFSKRFNGNLTTNLQRLTLDYQSSSRFFKNFIFFLKKFLKKYKAKVLDDSLPLVSTETSPTLTLFSNQLKRDLRQKYQQFNSLIDESAVLAYRRSLLPYLYTGLRYVKYVLIQNILRYPLYKVFVRMRYSLSKYKTWVYKRLQKQTHPSNSNFKLRSIVFCSSRTQLNEVVRSVYLLVKRLSINSNNQHSTNTTTPFSSTLNTSTLYFQPVNIPTTPTLYKPVYNRYFFNIGGFVTFLQNSLTKLPEVLPSKGLASPNNWLVITQRPNLVPASLQLMLRTSFTTSSKPFLQRFSISSYYNTPFIFSNIGFLFITSPNTLWSSEYDYDKGITLARINSHRYSFFYKNDLKRIYMRKPGFLKMLTSFQNESTLIEFTETFLPTQFKLAHNYTALPSHPLLTSTIASKYFTTSIDQYRPLTFYKGLGDTLESDASEYTIKRIRFKPGYQRIWRNARVAINFTLKFHFRYQIGLTKKLTRLKNVKRHDAMKLQELKLVNLLMGSQFTFDLNSTKQLISSENVFVNGNLVTNSSFNTFVGDFIQLSISLRYYITYKWLVNWNNYFSLKFTKLLNFKNNSSRSDLSKQTSSTFPDWIFNIGYRRFDIPNFLEVDYLTLSTFIIYEPLAITDYNPFTYLDSRVELYTMYNWKFIT